MDTSCCRERIERLLVGRTGENKGIGSDLSVILYSKLQSPSLSKQN